jgi:hypothetical protein
VEVSVKSLRFSFFALAVLLLLSVSCNKSDSASSSDNNSSSESMAKGGSESKSKSGERVVIPAGTSILVRTGETLSSKSSQAGQGFSATVAKPVVVDGKTVIEEGAAAHGTVVDAKAMGHFKGGALLHVRLTSVTINGHEQNIETSAAGSSLKGKGKRSAIAIGGGAGAGAILGGIFGGGKGAAIGAAAGGGAGTAGAAFTGNKEIVLPAETALTFTLKAPVDVK